MRTIAEKIGVTKCVKEAFKSDKNCDSDFVSKMIVDLACYSILTGSTAYQHFPTYAFKSPVLTKKVYSDSYICEFLRNDINEYKIQAFFDSWVKENNNNGTILISYDSTNINCVSDGITLVANGHAKDDDSKPIVNISYVIDQKEGTPLFYELYNGAINDVTEVKKMLEKANNCGFKNEIFVADRGYFSKSNLQKILKNFHAFVMMVSLKNNFVKSKIDEVRSNIVDSNNYILPDKVFGTFVETKLYKDDLDGEEKYVYIYFNKAKFTQDKEELMSILVLEKNNLMKKINNGEAILFDSDFKEKYPQFDVEYDEKNLVIYYLKISNEYLISKLKYSGFFILVSNIKRSPEEMLSIYRKRDLIEKEFRQMKSQIGFNALNVQSDASLRSKVFIMFIASILRSYIMRKTTEKRKYGLWFLFHF